MREMATGIVEAKANALIDEFISKGVADLRSSFASPLSVHTVLTMLGLPTKDYELVRAWYDDFAVALANFSHDPEVRRRGLDMAGQFKEQLRARLRELEKEPDESLLSTLARLPDKPLSEEEILSNAMLILFGGIETTESMILNAIWALMVHGDQFEEVRRNDELIDAAIEESLRWEPAVQTCTRYARKTVTMRGVEIAEGEIVQCMLGAANRDPAYFKDPDQFDIRRHNAADHVSFGVGTHFCLGASLARLETQISLRLLFDRLPGLVLDPERPGSPRGYEFRKPPTLYVRWQVV